MVCLVVSRFKLGALKKDTHTHVKLTSWVCLGLALFSLAVCFCSTNLLKCVEGLLATRAYTSWALSFLNTQRSIPLFVLTPCLHLLKNICNFP